jgi:hypothetical protein
MKNQLTKLITLENLAMARSRVSENGLAMMAVFMRGNSTITSKMDTEY